MFTSVLVANRGEIAVRIVKTLRKMGIRSVVVTSIPDRHSLAVRTADASVLLEGYSAAETYLDIDAVIAAAKAEGCEAIHPGYGFLSERADFAERCQAEGIVFIGPPPAVLRGMGDKAAARQLAVRNGVPVVPGWDGDDDGETLLREAKRIGVPLMVKARGGGGGRGMREVFELADLPEALTSARREAESAFGDPGLLLEKLVTKAHHVEVQVVADAHGNVVHLGERDCSVQRRHQKLIEETPSPVVDAQLRAELTGAALRLARAINYINAGTFEFLVGEPDATTQKRPFYFLEVNPRLQVEHPVTEMVTGLDLVELQIRIAAGEPMPFSQDDVEFNGHAIEFRINAEDPWDGFKPSSDRFAANLCIAEARCDVGFESGDLVPTQYDSLVAKAIFWSADRASSLSHARAGLETATWRGPRTNLRLHAAIIGSDAFRTGGASIDWLEANLAQLLDDARSTPEEWAAGAASALQPRRSDNGATNPFAGLGWIGAGAPGCWLDDGVRTQYVRLRLATPNRGVATVGDHAVAFELTGACVSAGGQLFGISGVAANRSISVHEMLDGQTAPRRFDLVTPPQLPRRARAAIAGVTLVVAPLAGTISGIRVTEGDTVETGQLLVLLEAMKMEHRITAPNAGTVKSVSVHDRDVVHEGDTLVQLS